ncbi:MAG: SMP-30/gluconolactonase/LRE family protein [Myxococcota bacterium]
MAVGLWVGCGDDSTGNAGAGGGGAGGSGLLDEYVLEDPELVPESGTFDAEGQSFYVGSETQGSITQVASDGTESIFFDPPAGESWRTLGMVADSAARRLWVCARRVDVVMEQVWVFDLEAGDRTLALNLEDAASGSTCNDIALDAGGLAYVSDSANPRIYRADADVGTVETWADDPLLASDNAQFGGNGIAVTEDDAFVLLSKTFAPATTPRLLRIDRADPTDISGITTTPELVGSADGMSFLDGDLYLAIVSPGEIFRIVSEDDWATATITATTAPAGTSTVRPADGSLYAIYSDISSSLLMMPLSPPFLIFRVDLDSFE